MQKKLGTLCLVTIMIIMGFAPAMSPVFSVMTTAASYPLDRGFEEAQGPVAEMKVPVVEDESVASNAPSSNFDGNENRGGVWVGFESGAGWGRAWVKFDLTFLPENIGIVSASFRAYLNDEWDPAADAAIGLYSSSNDTWEETSITWDNQPGFDAAALDTISPPYNSSIQNWYDWTCTDVVLAALSNDKMLTLVLKQEVEEGTDETWEYFVEKEYDQLNATYLAIEYTAPEAASLEVDGFSSSPHIDYIQNSEPTLSWSTEDSGIGETQMDYEVEVWDNEYFNDTLLYHDARGEVETIFDSGVGANTRPFGTALEFRYQMKHPSSLLARSGLVDKLYFEVEDDSGVAVFEDLQILMASTSKSGDLLATYAWNYNDSTPIQVLNREVYEAQIIDGWLVVDVENSFYSSMSKNLIIDMRFTNNTGDLSRAYIESPSVGSVAYNYGEGAYYSSTATFLYERTHNVRIEYATEPVLQHESTVSNSFPFNTEVGEPGIFQMKYNKSLVPETGIIDRLFIGVGSLTANSIFENLTIRLVETPHQGMLNHSDFTVNYGGNTPVTVLDEGLYAVPNIAGCAAIDIDDVFEYTGEGNLLVELRWDSLLEGGMRVYRDVDAGGYRAWNMTYSGLPTNNADTVGVDMHVQFVQDSTSIAYDGTALSNNTAYYWRVRVMDTTGVWSDWTTQNFTYAVLTSEPEWSNLSFDPDVGVAGSESTVSIDVTYLLGVEAVWFEIDGSNQSMTADGDTYSYSWTPSESGNFTYAIYMESSIGTWSTTSGIYEVEAAPLIPGLPIDSQTLLLIIVGVLVVVIIVLLVRRRK
ncbi:DNRLRE domain-containing protein [Candidatus Thorarchaeota archaeon]|nr:MAG: DNRLRE domain-containing protein [Candidatus Thorarchaeota archaeon]